MARIDSFQNRVIVRLTTISTLSNNKSLIFSTSYVSLYRYGSQYIIPKRVSPGS